MIKDIFKGLLIGICKVIPGISGALLAVLFGLYDKLLNLINDFKHIKENIINLFPVLLGIILGIILTSNLMKYLYGYIYLELLSIFLGICTYELYELYKNTNFKKVSYNKLLLPISITILFSILIIFFYNNTNITSIYHHNIDLIICGIIETISIIVPGLSGTAILVSIGYYDEVLCIFSNPFININNTIYFSIGFISSLILLSKLISYLYKKYYYEYSFIIFILASISILSLFINIIVLTNLYNFYIPLILFLIGYKFTKYINNIINLS